MAVALACLFLATATAGCYDPFRPLLPKETLGASPHDWVREDFPETSHGVLGPNFIETEYRFDPTDQPPYPGLLTVVGVRAASRISLDDLLQQTREVLEETLEDEGVVVDVSREIQGKRTVDSGAESRWIRLVGGSRADSVLFEQEQEVRALAEAWYDGRSKTSIIAVALAQTTGPSGLLGQTVVRNEAVWTELVGDPEGSIEGRTYEDGFIYSLVTHS